MHHIVWFILILTTQFIFYYQPYVDRSHVIKYMRNLFSSNYEFYICSILFVNFMTRVIVDIFYVLLYYFKPSCIEKYRINKKWLWETMTPIAYYKKIIGTLFQVILINILIVIPLTLISFDESKHGYKVDPDMVPVWYISFFQIMIALIMYDFLFFAIHKMLHTKHLYWIHKMHHEYYNTVIWSDAHTGLLEVLFVAIFPYMIIGLVIDLHLYTQCMLIIVSISLGISQHSGYNLPYSPFHLIPLCNTYGAHVLHHRFTNVNYAPYWSFWDRVTGSYKPT